MIDWILEPLQYSFFIRGLTGGLFVAVGCGILSAFIVWRGMSFIGDALAHAVLPGIVLAVMLGINILVGALAAALASAAGIGVLSRRRGFKDDTAIGVIFTGAFALGILLMGKVSTYQDLTHILFGNVLGISSENLVLIGISAAIVVLSVIIFYKELLVGSFDTVHSTAIGLSPRLVQGGLLFLIAVTTVIASQTVGIVLVLALLVTPAAASSLISRKMKQIILLSLVFSLASVIAGFYLSYYLDLATGSTIVLILTLIFGICFFAAHKGGEKTSRITGKSKK